MKKIISMVLIASIGIICSMDRSSQGTNFSTLPEELKTIEIIKANIATAKDAIEAIKNLKKLTLTSKADKNRIEKYIQGHIDKVCQWLNAKTNNLARSLYLLEVSKLITDVQAEKAKTRLEPQYSQEREKDHKEFLKARSDFYLKNDEKSLAELLYQGTNINQAASIHDYLIAEVVRGSYLKPKFGDITQRVKKLIFLLKAPFIDVNIFSSYNGRLMSPLGMVIAKLFGVDRDKSNEWEMFPLLLADPRVNLDKIDSEERSALDIVKERQKNNINALKMTPLIENAMNHRKAKPVVDAFVESLKPYAKKK